MTKIMTQTATAHAPYPANNKCQYRVAIWALSPFLLIILCYSIHAIVKSDQDLRKWGIVMADIVEWYFKDQRDAGLIVPNNMLKQDLDKLYLGVIGTVSSASLLLWFVGASGMARKGRNSTFVDRVTGSSSDFCNRRKFLLTHQSNDQAAAKTMAPVVSDRTRHPPGGNRVSPPFKYEILRVFVLLILEISTIIAVGAHQKLLTYDRYSTPCSQAHLSCKEDMSWTLDNGGFRKVVQAVQLEIFKPGLTKVVLDLYLGIIGTIISILILFWLSKTEARATGSRTPSTGDRTTGSSTSIRVQSQSSVSSQPAEPSKTATPDTGIQSNQQLQKNHFPNVILRMIVRASLSVMQFCAFFAITVVVGIYIPQPWNRCITGLIWSLCAACWQRSDIMLSGIMECLGRGGPEPSKQESLDQIKDQYQDLKAQFSKLEALYRADHEKEQDMHSTPEDSQG